MEPKNKYYVAGKNEAKSRIVRILNFMGMDHMERRWVLARLIGIDQSTWVRFMKEEGDWFKSPKTRTKIMSWIEQKEEQLKLPPFQDERSLV
jgi:hypothetical protein